MKRKKLLSVLSFVLLFAVIISCSKDDPEPTTGKLTGKVTQASGGQAIENVQVIVFNADDNSPAGFTATTDANGNFSVSLPPGNYFLKYYKQGFDPLPAAGMDAVAFTITVGATTDQLAELTSSIVTNAGYISGKVSSGASGVAGVLVVAEDNTNLAAYSTISDKDGKYTIYNVPAGSYSVIGYAAGYNSAAVAATSSANAETKDINIALTSGATGTLNGTIRNLAADNKDVDVSLVHPITRETIPGLTTTSVNLAYSISNVPNGMYIARATFKNDERVMDPDRIAKFGEPIVEFAGSTIALTFDITGSVKLVSPTNLATTNQPLEVTSTTPTFEWTAYSSTSDYVIEVVDAATGAIVWGGFDYSTGNPVKNITIPSSQKTVVYNFDGTAAIPQLVQGRIYRWRIYASKNDQNSTTGWTLISASEDQQGLIKIVQ